MWFVSCHDSTEDRMNLCFLPGPPTEKEDKQEERMREMPLDYFLVIQTLWLLSSRFRQEEETINGWFGQSCWRRIDRRPYLLIVRVSHSKGSGSLFKLRSSSLVAFMFPPRTWYVGGGLGR